MQKAKKMSKQTLVIAVLAVLLVLSLALTVTGAWFTDTATASSNTEIQFAKVDVTNEMIKPAGQDHAFSHTRSDGSTKADLLLPGDKVSLNGKISNGDSTVSIYIAVKLGNISVKGKIGTGDYTINIDTMLGANLTHAGDNAINLTLPGDSTVTDTRVTCADGSKIYLVTAAAGDISYSGTITFSTDITNSVTDGSNTYYLNAGATGATAANTITGVKISASVNVYAIQADNIGEAADAKTELQTLFTDLATAA